MTLSFQTLAISSLALAAANSAAAQTSFISDDFETNTSSDYTLIDDGSPDGMATFNFDYSTAGIPLAPRSAMGETGGVKIEVNTTLGAVDAITLFHNTPITADQYLLTVDVFMAFVPGGPTTEHAHVGVGGDGASFNQLFSPIAGSGAYIAFTGDGGSISDYRWFRAVPNTPMGQSSNTTLPNSHQSYLGNGSQNTGPFFQSLFPSPPATVAGSPGNIWTTVKIEVDNIAGQISFYFDDQLTFQGAFGGRFDGFASIGLADVFTSVAPATSFVVYDNFEVGTNPMSVGSNYCTAVPNSTGVIGTISAMGSVNAAANSITLAASGIPSNQFGIFVTSLDQAFVPGAGGTSNGNLCVGGTIGRFSMPGQIVNAGNNGMFSLPIDLTAVPQGSGTVSVAAGQTWHYQAWYRDNVGVGSNFTDGLEVMYQ